MPDLTAVAAEAASGVASPSTVPSPGPGELDNLRAGIQSETCRALGDARAGVGGEPSPDRGAEQEIRELVAYILARLAAQQAAEADGPERGEASEAAGA